MVERATVIITMKEWPHVDVPDRAREILDAVVATRAGRLHPCSALFDCRMIGAYPTRRDPMRDFVDRLRAAERTPGVISVSLAHGYPWADVPDVGSRMLVVTDGDPALAASRLSLGGSYDELIDIQSNATYVSTAGDSAEGRYVDYGFISTFPGPGRNRVVVISGTRDTGVMMAAEAATSAATLKDLATQAGNAPSFETLFEIQGVARSGMKSKMLFVAPVEAQGIWEMP